MVRCGRKNNNSAESDLNKALNYISSAKEEFSFLRRIFMKLTNTFTFEGLHLEDIRLSDIINSIIRFDDPNKIAKMIVEYADYKGIYVNPDYRELYE